MVRSAKVHTPTVEAATPEHRIPERFWGFRLRRLLAWSLESAFILSGACVPLAASQFIPAHSTPNSTADPALESPVFEHLQATGRWLLAQPKLTDAAVVPPARRRLEILAVVTPLRSQVYRFISLVAAGRPGPSAGSGCELLVRWGVLAGAGRLSVNSWAVGEPPFY
ncbi:MAG: hypothetical protein HC816_05615 [Leptolyngbyaceae cyanobacterium RM1_1_2]|nr:hypothetical protein [Leptolyngbyaceae cyanobacterium RM1_1_2]